MPEVDFAMTYPCHFLMNGQGNPESVVIDGESCICLFTDRDLVERFYKDKYGDNFATRAIEVLTMPERLALIQTLRDWQPQLTPQGCIHVAIDTSPGKTAAYVTFAELLKELEKHAD
jgi:hypothetical protein